MTAAPPFEPPPHPEALLVYDLPAATYHADPCAMPSLNQSTAKHIVHGCLARAYLHHPKLGATAQTATDAMDSGTIRHALTLGKDIEGVEVVEGFKDWRKNDAKDAKAKVIAAGKTPMLEHEVAVYDDATAATKKQIARIPWPERFDREGEPVTLDGASEVSGFWWEDVAGFLVACRTRMDHLILSGLPDDPDTATIVELKFVGDAHPKKCQKAIENDGYDIQAHAQTRAVEKAFPSLTGRVRFLWLFCETKAPFVVTPIDPAESMQQLGRIRWEQAVAMWADAITTDKWPGFAEQAIHMSASKWAFDDMEGGDDGA